MHRTNAAGGDKQRSYDGMILIDQVFQPGLFIVRFRPSPGARQRAVSSAT